MKTMKLFRWAAMGLGMLLAMRGSALATSPWEQPAGALAEQIAAILGSGQAHLTIRNLSRIPNDDVPAIRKLLAQDLKEHGVTVSESSITRFCRTHRAAIQRLRLQLEQEFDLPSPPPYVPATAPLTQGRKLSDLRGEV